MFNEADETGLAPDQVMGGGDKRANLIPALAEYKMPGLRGVRVLIWWTAFGRSCDVAFGWRLSSFRRSKDQMLGGRGRFQRKGGLLVGVEVEIPAPPGTAGAVATGQNVLRRSNPCG